MTPEEAVEKFLEIKELFRRMAYEVCGVVENYHIWKTLVFARSVSEVGREQAEKNTKLMNLYRNFFIPTEQSNLKTFIIGLMNFFDDKDPRVLSFASIVKEIKKHQKHFTPEVARMVHDRLGGIGTIKDSYIPITQSTINHINKIRDQHKSLIENLTIIRNKQCAHTDIILTESTFVPKEVEILIAAVQKTLNKLTTDFVELSTLFYHRQEDAVKATQSLLKNLEKIETHNGAPT